MKKLLIIILLSFFSITSYCQTSSITRSKATKVFTYYKNNKINATDSVIRMLSKDKWFNSLSVSSQHFRINRINYYKKITIRRPKNSVYLKGWVLRALQ